MNCALGGLGGDELVDTTLGVLGDDTAHVVRVGSVAGCVVKPEVTGEADLVFDKTCVDSFIPVSEFCFTTESAGYLLFVVRVGGCAHM